MEVVNNLMTCVIQSISRFHKQDRKWLTVYVTFALSVWPGAFPGSNNQEKRWIITQMTSILSVGQRAYQNLPMALKITHAAYL